MGAGWCAPPLELPLVPTLSTVMPSSQAAPLNSKPTGAAHWPLHLLPGYTSDSALAKMLSIFPQACP